MKRPICSTSTPQKVPPVVLWWEDHISLRELRRREFWEAYADLFGWPPLPPNSSPRAEVDA